jgi:two-component system sensor histidine kinase UhpB
MDLALKAGRAKAKEAAPALEIDSRSSTKFFDLRSLWYGRSVRTQLLLAVGLINLLGALIAGGIAIFNTRMATRVEIEASLEVAQRFVSATVKDLAAQGKLDELPEQLPLQLKNLRHVRILLVDAFGNMTLVSPQRPDGAQNPRWVPSWFTAWVSPKLAGRAVKVIAADNRQPVIIVGEPADEIAEAWRDFYVLALAWLVLNAFILAVLYVVLGRVLDPLANLSRGLHSLEDGDYGTRLRLPKVRELTAIAGRFNMLATALDTARDENKRLYRQLISVQEQERREIANELHDEAGPCLFGITANASSIRTIADQVADRRSAEIAQRVGIILSIAERLKLMNRALLKKLRPGPLGDVKLAELLEELISDFQRHHPGTEIGLSLRGLANSYGEAIHVTLYRCIQEGITNAIRHGDARTVEIEIEERRQQKRGKPTLNLAIKDDGIGFAPATPKGFGLTTMTERMRSLGGSCVIESVPGKGATLRIQIPIQRSKSERASRPDLAMASG